ncbi:hypothetical protein MRX96_045879 [Rhipicephalus microplus]
MSSVPFMARAPPLASPDSKGPVKFSQDCIHAMGSSSRGIYPKGSCSGLSSLARSTVPLLFPRSRKFWSRKLALSSSLTKLGRCLNATPGECVTGATFVVETARSDPPTRPSAAALTDASSVGALGLLVGRRMAVRLARRSSLRYRLQKPLGQAPPHLQKRTMAGRSAIDPAGVRSALLRRGFSTCCCA